MIKCRYHFYRSLDKYKHHSLKLTLVFTCQGKDLLEIEKEKIKDGLLLREQKGHGQLRL